MLQAAIPFFTTLGNRSGTDPIQIGTAFLATHLGIRYLVTAAHIPNGIQPITNDWASWEPSMTIRLPDGDVSFDLFHTAPDGTRTPGFAYRLTDSNPNHLHDVMWFPLLGGPWSDLGRRLAQHFTEFTLDPRPYAGPITAHGYPDSDTWPQLETAQGWHAGDQGLLHHLTARTKKGYSGGPAVDPFGSLFGMLIAATDDETGALIVPTHVLRFFLNEYATNHNLTP